MILRCYLCALLFRSAGRDGLRYLYDFYSPPLDTCTLLN